VAPEFIPDYLALVGDSADGYPGIRGLGPRTAATLISRHGHIEDFPADVLSGTNRELGLLFKDLATLRIDIPLFKNVNELEWKRAKPSFATVAQKIDDKRLLSRIEQMQNRES
jgi:5'-3' exonuclease